MAQITIETIAGGFRQMTAPEECWITQAAEVELTKRLYFRRRIMLGSETAADWRVATEAEAEKAEYEALIVAEGQIPLPEQITHLADTLAHSDCTLAERLAAVERLLLDVLSGKTLVPELQVRKLRVWGDNNLILVGNGAPAKAPDMAGQFYIDTVSGAVYKSTGNAGVSDWKIV